MKFDVPFVLLRCPIREISLQAQMPEKFPENFYEGIYLASYELFSELDRISLLKGKDRKKLDKSIRKYWLRSCSRSTPFGVFAGSTLLTLGNSCSEVVLEDSGMHRRSLRLDMNLVAEIIRQVIQIREIKERIRFYPNNSLYETPTSFRYVEYGVEAGVRKYKHVSVEKTDYLSLVLNLSADGRLLADIVKELVRSEDVDECQARDYVDSLLDSQILYSELEPAVTGEDPFTVLIEKLKALEIENNLLKKLFTLGDRLNNLYAGIDQLKELRNIIRSMELPMDSAKNLFQVDLFLSTSKNQINSSLVNRIVEQANELMYLSRPLQIEALENFINRFTAKYDQAEIALNIALDADLGVGYGDIDSQVGDTQLVDDLRVFSNATVDKIKFDAVSSLIGRKYLEFLGNSEKSINLREDEISLLKEFTNRNRFPNSMYLIGSLLTGDGEDELKDFEFDVQAFGGPSAANLLGRFTHGNADLYGHTVKLLEEEEKSEPDCIFAEIVHLPQARTGNVVIRPLMRKYEIPYVGISGISQSNQIPLSDILVSVKNGTVLLRSRKHNRRIIPRLSSAHNFSNNALPAYRFLGDLQLQGLSAPIFWDWGVFGDAKHLPRVCYKNLIIKKGQWKVEEKDFKKKVAELEFPEIEEFRLGLSLPKLVIFAENDNELLIDFSSTSGIALFKELLDKHKVLVVSEFLFDGKNSFVKDSFNSSYCNQLVIPIDYKDEVPYISPQLGSGSNTKRSFLPGSAWNYYKLYCGSNTADQLLSRIIHPFIEKAIESSLFERFHFVRYRDDFAHLRIRFYNINPVKQQALNSLFLRHAEKYLSDGLINRLTIDTYERELERYGSGLIEKAEDLFDSDSLACLRFLALLDGSEEAGKYRLLFSLRGIDMLLEDFGFDMQEKHGLLKTLQNAFFNEFGAHPALQKMLNSKYRHFQNVIFSHMNPSRDEENEITEAVQIFKVRSQKNKVIVKEIQTEFPDLNVMKTQDLLSSLIHMFMNRMFSTRNRSFELLVYHFLEKYYGSQLALLKQGTARLTVI